MSNAANAPNRHCCAVEIGGTGILIEGPSGSGKTSLALGLVDTAKRRGVEAHFIADDQALIERGRDRIWAVCPPAIAGLSEVFGHGVARVAHKDRCEVGLLVRLVDDRLVERMPEPRTAAIEGLEVPLVEVPVRHEAQAVRIVLASLRISVI